MSYGPNLVGATVGSYGIEKFLGSGAFKSVYRARNREAGKNGYPELVALCIPHAQDEEARRLLENEYRVVSTLSHPAIVRVHGLEESGGLFFMIMELVEGDPLNELLKTHGPLGLEEAVKLIRQVGEALDYAHEGLAIHRDIKPGNLLRSTDGRVKVLDFGLARLMTHSRYKATTRVGSVAYMAPEQFEGATGLNADLWSLGLTFFQIITNTLPFPGHEEASLIRQILYEDPDLSPIEDSELPSRLVGVMRKILEKDPEKRYRAARDFVADLEAVLRQAKTVSKAEGQIEVLLRAHFPLVFLQTYEEDRALETLGRVRSALAQERDTGLFVWRETTGLTDHEGRPLPGQTGGNPLLALKYVVDSEREGIYVFIDIHRHLTPVTVRLVRDAVWTVKRRRKSLVFISPVPSLPDELKADATLVYYDLPDLEELKQLVEDLAKEGNSGAPSRPDGDAPGGQTLQGGDERVRAAKERDSGESPGKPGGGVKETPAAPLSEAEVAAIHSRMVEGPLREGLARAVLGLTRREAERVLRRSLLKRGGLDQGCMPEALSQKEQMVRKAGILDYCRQDVGFTDVGGLDRLKAWFEKRRQAFTATGQRFGLKAPKGVVLVGVPGCGKSLSAKALAREWDVPLLRLDVGRIYSSLVGSSEANLRLALHTAAVVSPCVLWVDELEKAFGGGGQGLDGGVSERLFGSFLSWLEERTAPIFVVATANDISRLPPEFLRKGRFDQTFYVGLPGPEERRAIFEVHIRKHRRNPQGFDLGRLAETSEGYTGAEIEEAVVSGLYQAFEEGERELATADILARMGEIVPLSRSRKAQVDALARWAEVNALSAQ